MHEDRLAQMQQEHDQEEARLRREHDQAEWAYRQAVNKEKWKVDHEHQFRMKEIERDLGNQRKEERQQARLEKEAAKLDKAHVIKQDLYQQVEMCYIERDAEKERREQKLVLDRKDALNRIGIWSVTAVLAAIVAFGILTAFITAWSWLYG
jgi:hypothetical protein